jgi:cytochrome c biogenesis factor
VVLRLPENMAHEINRWLAAANNRSSFTLPLYDPAAPPRYVLPFWLENEKYLFWFLAYAGMALFAWRRLSQPFFRILLQVLLVIQVTALCLACNPFHQALPLFFQEISPWFSPLAPMSRLGLFMQFYLKLIFYYNAHYMWIHPPLLFLAYAGLTVFFAGCVAMLWSGESACETMAYAYAKASYLFLTLGMLLGYPWALQAWGPNWWWDPKVASSLMMWIVFSTYLHARLYLSRRGMWGFVGGLGILCFCAMLFTFTASFFFPGEHTGH